MPTRREQILGHLSQEAYTPKALAKLMEMKVRDVLDDLEHVRRTAGPRFKVRPAACSRCDFVFKDRARLGTPSRCPRCRSERIEGPWLSVEPAQGQA